MLLTSMLPMIMLEALKINARPKTGES